MGSICGGDRLIQVLFCKFDACKYPRTKAGATPDGPEFASSRRIFRLVPPAGAGTRRYENETLVVGSVWVWLVPPLRSGFPLSRECRRGLPGIDRVSGARRVVGTCFRTNRSRRLVPAHQSMKIGCIG